MTLADVATRLQKLADDRPELGPAIDEIACVLADMPVSPCAEAPSSRWTWPRAEWAAWRTSVDSVFGGVPLPLWRSLVLHFAKHPGAWLQMAGREGNFVVQVYDPNVAFGDITQLGWESLQDPGFPGVFWVHSLTMAYPEGVVDRAAQAMALILGLTPEDVTLEPLTY